ncbi:MAG: anhydro-N-acetylmuramic acid kinase [Oleiphilaceae bacterium]|jgi:anhydro-N-acetylmuramic acid kinase
MKTNKTALYIGIMSGTSMDAVDAVLVAIDNNKIETLGHHSNEIPLKLRRQLSELCSPGDNEIERCGELDILIAELTAKTVNTLLKNEKLQSQDILAIGSHGQTVRHLPNATKPFSLQIGNPSVIAHKTNITTIADFRMADIAAGGQGAPLVPAFHQAAFQSKTDFRAIINIGGIANITLLQPDDKTLTGQAVKNQTSVKGYDLGPGNTLMDQWILHYLNKEFDMNGDWARTGKIIPLLLNKLLADEFIQKTPPKSSGREYFNLSWLNHHIENTPETKDVQRTLIEFTALVITNAVKLETDNQPCDVFLCGGGVKNCFLQERIKLLLPNHTISTTGSLGIDAQLVEATAFAWLAKQTLNRLPGNIEAVTGASRQKILGGIYLA